MGKNTIAITEDLEIYLFERQGEIFHLLVYSPIAYNQAESGWTRSRNSIQVSCMGSRDLRVLESACPAFWVHWMGTGSEAEVDGTWIET